MDEGAGPAEIRVRPAAAEDADGIARVFHESAGYHASLDPERYSVPAIETISARYREGQQHRAHAAEDASTFVAELGDQIIGFIDARLEQSPDPMHREITYCHIVEIAVSTGHQNQGTGERLLRAAEDWGRGRGAELASLEYLSANTRAGAFYQQRMGYRVAALIAVKRL